MQARMASSSTTPVRLLTWAAIVLAAGLLIFGVARHGLSLEVQSRFWHDIADRAHGPMTFRLFLQPAMAFLAALPDGIRDAREGHQHFFWQRWRDPNADTGRLREGFESVARVFLLGISMDVIYQLRVSDTFYPAEAVMIAILLAIVPYFIFRPIIEAVARRLKGGADASQK
ncbi:MAG: hypothetical protein JNL61_04550 [Rhizobiaceae bacterium]|nr:hypothetical protein [Rhizobiaceae bacterium]